MPNDDEFSEVNLYGQLSYFRGQVFSILYHTKADACVDPHSDGYVRLQALSRFTHGLVTVQDGEDIGDVRIFNKALTALTPYDMILQKFVSFFSCFATKKT